MRLSKDPSKELLYSRNFFVSLCMNITIKSQELSIPDFWNSNGKVL